MNAISNHTAVKSIGATVLAGLLLRLPVVRAIPLMVIGLAVSLLRPALLVLGIVKAVDLLRSRCDDASPQKSTNP